jgi:hypothetical protein
MAGGVNLQGKVKKKPVLQDYPRSPASIPAMHDVPSVAARQGRTGGAHPPGGLTRKRVPLGKSLETSVPNAAKANKPTFPARPEFHGSNAPKAKNMTGQDRPTVVPKNTQVATSKSPASGKMSYEAPAGAAVKKRGPVVSSQVMDARMNNQRTIRGKLRDSSR